MKTMTTMWQKSNSFSHNIQNDECVVVMLGFSGDVVRSIRANLYAYGTLEPNKRRFSDSGYSPG